MAMTQKQYFALLKKTGKTKPQVAITDGYRSRVSGWRTIGGKRCYFRSLWEINYCHYCQWEKMQGIILDWVYEPHTFAFPKDTYRTGPFYYKPDFLKKYPNDVYRWVEVKGHLNPSSKKKIKRFAKHHANQGPLEVIGPAWFKEVRRRGLHKLVPGWESLPTRSR